jgi:hypothetical protein
MSFSRSCWSSFLEASNSPSALFRTIGKPSAINARRAACDNSASRRACLNPIFNSAMVDAQVVVQLNSYQVFHLWDTEAQDQTKAGFTRLLLHQLFVKLARSGRGLNFTVANRRLTTHLWWMGAILKDFSHHVSDTTVERSVARLIIDDPHDQEGLVDRIADGVGPTQILNYYHYGRWPKEKAYCAKCGARRHRDGFTIELDNGAIALAGSKMR